jgi:predicted transcriptional regulator
MRIIIELDENSHPKMHTESSSGIVQELTKSVTALAAVDAGMAQQGQGLQVTDNYSATAAADDTPAAATSQGLSAGAAAYNNQ